MSTSPKPSTSDKLLSLMIVAGFMLLLTALPLGLVLSLQEHYKFHSDWRWAIIFGTVMTAATAVIGGTLLCTGELIVRRRGKTRV
jgi:hypothetical protein